MTNLGTNWMNSGIYLGYGIYDFFPDVPTFIFFQDAPNHDKRKIIFSICNGNFSIVTCQNRNINRTRNVCLTLRISLGYLDHTIQASARLLSHWNSTLGLNRVKFCLRLHHQLQHKILLLVRVLQYEPMKDLHMSTCVANKSIQ